MFTHFSRTNLPHLLLAAALVACVSGTTTHAAPVAPVFDKTLLFDDFEGNGLGTGDGTSVNGGFGTFGSTGNYTITEDAPDSTARLSTPDSGSAAGIVSNSAIDTSSVFTVRWDIDDIDSFPGNSEGYQVGLSSSSSGGFDLNIFIDWGREVEISADGQTIVADSLDDPAIDAGATANWVEATLDSTGFLIQLQGATKDVTGDWSDFGVNFNDLSDNNGMTYVTAGFRDRSGKNTPTSSVEFDTIQVTTIPEPAAAALIGLGGVLMLRRRSRG